MKYPWTLTLSRIRRIWLLKCPKSNNWKSPVSQQLRLLLELLFLLWQLLLCTMPSHTWLPPKPRQWLAWTTAKSFHMLHHQVSKLLPTVEDQPRAKAQLIQTNPLECLPPFPKLCSEVLHSVREAAKVEVMAKNPVRTMMVIKGRNLLTKTPRTVQPQDHQQKTTQTLQKRAVRIANKRTHGPKLSLTTLPW